MGTVPQRQDYPALARRSHAPTPAKPSRPRGLTPAARALCRSARRPGTFRRAFRIGSPAIGKLRRPPRRKA